MDAEELVTVFVSQGPLAAEVAKGKLEIHGIQAMLRYSPLGKALGITIDGLGRVDVLVRREDADRARDVLSETPESGGASPNSREPTDQSL